MTRLNTLCDAYSVLIVTYYNFKTEIRGTLLPLDPGFRSVV